MNSKWMDKYSRSSKQNRYLFLKYLIIFFYSVSTEYEHGQTK